MAAVVACAAGAPAARAERITGTFTFADVAPGTQESSSTLQRPIADAKVEIHRCVPGFLGICIWGKARDTRTDAAGRIDESFVFAGDGTTYGVKVFATNDAAVVWPNDVIHTVPFHREPGEDDGGPPI